jgi:hypothetical protein
MPWVAKNCKTGTGLTDAVMNELAEREEFVKCGEFFISHNETRLLFMNLYRKIVTTDMILITGDWNRPSRVTRHASRSHILFKRRS